MSRREPFSWLILKLEVFIREISMNYIMTNQNVLERTGKQELMLIGCS